MSDFSPGHRFSLSGSYRIPAGPAGITLAAYYDAQQGRPYSYLDGSDSNRDGTRGNDLLYVPRDAADVIVTDGTFDDLMGFLSAGCDVTLGTIVPRNACRGPWVYTLDFRLGVDFPRGPNEVELFLDVRNLINAFDARNGLVEFAFFQNLQPVRSSVDQDSGRYVYSLNSPARPGPGSPATASPATTCGAAGRRSWGCATRSDGRAGLGWRGPRSDPSARCTRRRRERRVPTYGRLRQSTDGRPSCPAARGAPERSLHDLAGHPDPPESPGRRTEVRSWEQPPDTNHARSTGRRRPTSLARVRVTGASNGRPATYPRPGKAAV